MSFFGFFCGKFRGVKVSGIVEILKVSGVLGILGVPGGKSFRKSENFGSFGQRTLFQDGRGGNKRE